MEHKHILIIGAGVLDVLVCPVEEDVFQKGSVSVDTIRLSFGGDGLNEATILARLKQDDTAQNEKAVRLLTLTGEDEAGAMIWEHCRKEKICMDLSRKEKEISTAVNIVMVVKDGNRSFFTNPRSSLRRLSIRYIPEHFPEDIKILCFASIFVSPLLTGKELAEVFGRAKKQGICVCADMTKCKNGETVREIREALGFLDYLFANREEAEMITGKSRVEEIAEILLEAGVKNAVIKCGGDGCFVAGDERTGWFPAAKSAKCIDTTGAGDSFVAGFLCALSEGNSLLECIRWANACGSLTVEAVGACTGIKNRKQVLERMNTLLY